MRKSSVLQLSALASLASAAQDAPIANNQPGAWALADFPSAGSSNIQAEIFAGTAPDGQGVTMTVNINGGDPLTGGPFSRSFRDLREYTLTIIVYHIHEKAIPSGGDCMATGAHLDPFSRGEDPPCNDKQQAQCQVGDISGKHGLCGTIPGCSMR
jgi:hypothetical protein